MKKSKFVLLSLIFIVFLGFGLIFGSLEVKAAGEHAWDWTAPQAAKNFVDIDGKGVRVYVFRVYADDQGNFDYAKVVAVRTYNFEDRTVWGSGSMYSVGSNYFDVSLTDLMAYYLSEYGSDVTISTEDRLYLYYDYEEQRFMLEYRGADYIWFWINKSLGSGYSDGWNDGYAQGSVDGYNQGYDVGVLDGYKSGHQEGYEIGYSDGYDAGNEVGYNEGLDVGYNKAYPGRVILLITLILFILSVFIYFKFKLKWVLLATILLWFVPIFLVENLFIKIFCVIMIIATITITFFNEREEF